MSSFTAQALVFIGSAVILVPIFQRLGFGSVLGYLIAGILVGPQGLKLIPDSGHVIHFAELGVVLLLFVIGLEIQPRKLWSMRRHLLGLGGIQVVATSAIFMTIGLACGLPPVAAGIIGFSLSLSSTAFALQTLTERNQFNTEFGRASFSVLLMQDLAAIPALAVIPLFAVSQTDQDASFSSAGLAVATIIGLFLASRWLIRPAFRLIASTRTREIFTAATLFIVLGVAALMQQAGLSAALGTFIAGVLLADSEYRHELESDLEPFKSLLMGLFFIGVGMGVSVDLITSKPVLVLSLALGYLAVKSIVIYGVGRLFSLNHENAKRMAVNIAQGGEFAFVIFGIAAQFQIAPSDTLTLLTAVITLSMALSPVMSVMAERLIVAHAKKRTPAPKYDEIQGETPVAIIAGFGRFGQIFGRILRAQDIPFVAIDHDSEQVELVRRAGAVVYYGDASRVDLLEKAGAAQAKYFILAIDDVEMSIRTAKNVMSNFPNLKIFARARNRGHVFDLMELGIDTIKRETFDSSAQFVRELLVDMGFTAERAGTVIEKFTRHDELMLEEQFKHRHDDELYMSVSRQGAAQLARVLNEDRTKSYVDPAA